MQHSYGSRLASSVMYSLVLAAQFLFAATASAAAPPASTQSKGDPMPVATEILGDELALAGTQYHISLLTAERQDAQSQAKFAACRARSTKEALARFEAVVSDPKMGHIWDAERAFLLENKAAVIEMLDSLVYAGHPIPGFCLGADGAPFRVATHREGVVLLVCGIADPVVYMTDKLNDKARAAAAIKTHFLPRVRAFAEVKGLKGVSYFGMCITYVRNDPGERASSASCESIAVLAPVEAAAKFSKQNITDDELIQASDVYLYFRELMKIKVKME